MPKKAYVGLVPTGKGYNLSNSCEAYRKYLNKEIGHLRKALVNWGIRNQKFEPDLKEKNVLCEYIRCYQQYTEYDQFQPGFTALNSSQVNLQRIQDIELIYKSFNLFKKLKFPVRFDSKFVARISQCQLEQIKIILAHAMHLADGFFIPKSQITGEYGYVSALKTKIFLYNRFFLLKYLKQKNILVRVGVQKVPVVTKNNIIKRYEYTSYIQFLDVLGDQVLLNPKKLDERMMFFYQKIIGDVAKKDHSDELQIELNKMSKYRTYLFYQDFNPYTGLKQTLETQFAKNSQEFHPLPFKVRYVSAVDTSTLIFDNTMKRWISKDHLDIQQRRKLNQYKRKVNQQLVKRFVDFRSARTLVGLLTKIPNFKVKLTEQEKDVIGQNGNVMAIGRSGTGKTTCAVLRLFSIQMLFKIRLALYKKKFQSQISNTRCSSSDIDQTVGLHCIFLTASPVLTHQIQRYYKKLTDNIKEELQKKKKRVEEERKRRKGKERRLREEQSEDHNCQLQPTTPSEYKQNQSMQKDAEQIRQVPQTIERAKSKQEIQEEGQMSDQLRGIQLKEGVQNQDFNEDQQDFDRVKEEFQQKVKRYQSLQDLTEKDYPGFFTVKSYIMMIDGTLPKPFFIRNIGTNAAPSTQSKASWHNQRKGVMMIENYYKNQEQGNDQLDQKNIEQIQEEINYSDEQELQHEYMRQIQLKENMEKQQLTRKLQARKKNKMSFEVDFEYFSTYFWPQVNRKFYSNRNITPQLVWTQIYSTIKGSAQSHQFPGQYLPQKVYMKTSTNMFLSDQQKMQIYQTFCQYERWKFKNEGYDIMDAVNYNLNVMRNTGFTGPQIHYVMIDQVQDLPHATICLLSKTASYGVFYSGDTAQTIAKGVGFRFCDLKSLFDQRSFDLSLNLKKPTVKHLTVNFRSHNSILQMANSVVSCLQILFPKTIDRLAKERSDLQGPKPMILAQNDQDLLFLVLCGQNQKSQSKNDSMNKPSLQFGCDQVIIVRDQQSKQNVPSMLQHALCLTIYQAKGLQFNDVILFNFFTQCKHPQKWNLLKYLQVVDYQISKEQYDRNLTKHSKEQQQGRMENGVQQNQEQLVHTECIVEQENGTVKIKKIVSDVKKIMKDINDYAELCSDLKLFYTAITRPRKTLIIYDQDPTCRKVVQKMWDKLGIIQIVTKSLIESQAFNGSDAQLNGTSIFKRVINSTDKNQWKKQGLKMYSRGYFEQAMKCFEKSDNYQLMIKAEANLLADKATKLLIRVQTQRNSIKQGFMGYSNLCKSDLSKLKRKLKHDQSQSYAQFNQAAIIFSDLSMHKQAGQCYFSGKKFQNAKDSFSKAKMIKQAAQSLQMMEDYKQAATLYDQNGDYLKVIECLDMLNQWEEILKIVIKYQQKMSQVQKTSLLKRYASLTLQSLVYQIQFQNQDATQNREKQPENKRIQIIHENESDQEDDSDDPQSNDSDPQVQAQQAYKNTPVIQEQGKQSVSKQGQSSQAIKIEPEKEGQIIQPSYQEVQIPQSISDSQSFSDLNQTEKQQKIQNSQKEMANQDQEIDQGLLQTIKQDSFADLNQPEHQSKAQNKVAQSSFSDLNDSQDFSDLNAKYEKQLDPDIQSIRSLADPEDPWIKGVISQISPKSEYSIIDQNQNYSFNVKIIKTKGNIFIQDQIMQKIVRVVSTINQSSTKFLQEFKGYQSLITLNKNENQKNVIQNSLINDFQDIDSQTIDIILDTLESFKLYKLCLFVCNRYHLPTKAGRYLVSIMMRYSTNCQGSTFAQSGLLAPSTQRKAELQKGILGSIAVHSILQNVNSQFMKIKISSDQAQRNTLGTYFIQGLILEGFYKKSVFMVDPKQALHILDNFCDYPLFRDICKNRFIKMTSQNQVFLDQLPQKQTEIKFSLLSLRDIMNKYQLAERFNMISHRYYKQFGYYDKVNYLKGVVIPDYLPYTQHIIKEQQNIHVFFDKKLPQTYKILTQGDELQTADAVLGLLCILHDGKLSEQLFRMSSLNCFLEYYRCIKQIRNIICKMDGPNSLNIIRNVLAFYQCKLIENCKSMNFIGSGYCFLNRTSNMANQITEACKVQPQMFAYFFQQDFNFIMIKISCVMKLIKNRFMNALFKFIKDRSQLQRFQNKLLPDDYALHNQELLIIEAIKQAMSSMGSNRDNNTPSDSKAKTKKTTKKLSSKPKFDYKTHGRFEHMYIANEQQLSEDEDEEVQNKYAQDKYVLPNYSKQMSYLAEQMISIFNRKAKQTQQIVIGKQLYCSNLNSYYREYIEKRGGYNLYDAVQFKRFKRIDMYADNILSIIDHLPISDKHVYTAQILILLLVEYKKLTQKKQLSLKMPSSYLKFMEDLRVLGLLGQAKIHQQQFEQFLSDDLHESISLTKNKFLFSYNYPYSSELSAEQLIQVISEYLEVLMYLQKSQLVNLTQICMVYLVNLTPDHKHFNLYQKLRRVINNLAPVWGTSHYRQLSKAKNYQDFIQILKPLMQGKKYHEIKVTYTENIDQSIKQSQNDYEIQTRIMNGRKKALGKILSWWRKNKIPSKIKLQNNIVNYFDWVVKNQDKTADSGSSICESLNDFRMLEKSENCNLMLNVPLILKIQNTRQGLLKFYLENIVSSSLDFHYILMSLRKIQALKYRYVAVCKQLQTGIVEKDTQKEISSIQESITEIQSNIESWKNDSKWLKQKNVSLKRKKVFQVKWMARSLNHMKIMKKRAGLKKQSRLQLKKNLLKG